MNIQKRDKADNTAIILRRYQQSIESSKNIEEQNLLIQIFNRIIQGKPITANELLAEQWLFVQIVVADGLGVIEGKKRLENFKLGLNDTFKSLEFFCNYTSNKLDEQMKDVIYNQERVANMPLDCTLEDSDELIEFAKKLNKSSFNYSEAAKLLGISRQTLKRYIIEKKYDLEEVRKKRSSYLTRKSIVNFYRNKILLRTNCNK
jgi:hypothetical protein